MVTTLFTAASCWDSASYVAVLPCTHGAVADVPPCFVQLVVNLVAVATACVGAIALQESPLTAVQMLWVNLIMDSLASLSLATEFPRDDLLDLPPYSPLAPLLTPPVSLAPRSPLSCLVHSCESPRPGAAWPRHDSLT